MGNARYWAGLVATGVCFLLSSSALAKSWTQVKRDLGDVSANVRVEPDGEWSEARELKETRGERLIYVVVGQFPYRVTAPTARSGVTRVTQFVALYHDGRFVQSNLGDGWLEGMPSLDLATLRPGVRDVLRRPPHNQVEVRQILSVERVAGTHDHWRNFQVAQIPLLVKYTVGVQRPTGPALVTVASRIQLLVANENEAGTGRWTVNSVASTTESADIESERPVTAEELAAIPTLDESEFFATYPANLQAPVFRSALEACTSFYDSMRGASDDSALRWNTYAMFNSVEIRRGQRPLPNDEIRQFIEQTTPAMRSLLRAGYPAAFTFDRFGDQTQQRVYFKSNRPDAAGTCYAVPVGDTWMVADINVPPGS